MVVFRGTCLITNPGNETRKSELQGIEEFAKLFGFKISRVQDPGTLDGGDVLKVGNTIYVGLSARTNLVGIKQLS